MSDQRRWGIAPYFIVDDVLATANFYRDKLGFHYQRLWGEPPCFTIVQRSGAHLMLRQLESPGQMRPNAHPADPEDYTWDAYLWIDDADTLYAEFQQKGINIVRPICNQEYNCRDFDILDCNGYRLCFGQDLAK
jgi:predicted enzyme related to lactoylglutathione lyase